MGHLLYAIAILMILAWLICYAGYNLGYGIHAMPLVALVLLVLSAVLRDKEHLRKS